MVKLKPTILIVSMIIFGSFANTAAASSRYLITDTNNHRIIEVEEKTISWQYGTVAVSNDIWSHRVAGISGKDKDKLNFPSSAERLAKGNTLIADTENQRVVKVSPQGKIVWSLEAADLEGSFYPVRARSITSGNVLVTDWAGHRVVEVSREKKIVWQYGADGISGTGFNELNYPQDGQRLKNGNTLIADTENQRVIEVNRKKMIVWQFGVTGTAWVGGEYLRNPLSAARLGNGNTLIVDEGNSRVIEVDQNKNVVWQYGGTLGNGVGQLNSPRSSFRLKNGNTLVADRGNHRVIEVSAAGKIVWQYGDGYRPGVGPNQLLYPSDVQEVKYPLSDPSTAKTLRALPPLNDEEYSLGFLWTIAGWAALCFGIVFGLYFYAGREHGG